MTLFLALHQEMADMRQRNNGRGPRPQTGKRGDEKISILTFSSMCHLMSECDRKLFNSSSRILSCWNWFGKYVSFYQKVIRKYGIILVFPFGKIHIDKNMSPKPVCIFFNHIFTISIFACIMKYQSNIINYYNCKNINLTKFWKRHFCSLAESTDPLHQMRSSQTPSLVISALQ